MACRMIPNKKHCIIVYTNAQANVFLENFIKCTQEQKF